MARLVERLMAILVARLVERVMARMISKTKTRERSEREREGREGSGEGEERVGDRLLWRDYKGIKGRMYVRMWWDGLFRYT